MIRSTMPAALALLLLAHSAPARAEDDILAKFEGSWKGSGTVQRDVDPSPRKVSCSIDGKRSPSGIRMSGTCRAAVIVRRAIGADIRLDPATGRFSGVYTGSSKGPAKISGTRRGDSLSMTITYPKPVYGDRTARMTLTSSGRNGFSLRVIDKVDGADKVTSDISFRR